jgi:hypothetical protein
MNLGFDTEQLRVLNWRALTRDIAAVVGPPGCGKTTVGSALAVKLVAEGLANRVLLVAYTNAAANEFCLELCDMLGSKVAKSLCLRTGNPTGVDPSIPIPFSRSANEIQEKSIIISTNLSLKKLPSLMRFDNMIIDEAGVERLEHLLWPLWFGVNNTTAQQYKSRYATDTATTTTQSQSKISDLMELISRCGTVATVVGDPKQSKPISPVRVDYSAIEWVIKKSTCDTLRISHRLPDRLSGLVNEFAEYDGLRSAPEISSRRLGLDCSPDLEFREIIQPDEVTTWVDINGNEQPIGPSSWANDMEAKACAKICSHLIRITSNKSIAVITRFSAQKLTIRTYLQRMGHTDIKVTTTTGALGTQADIVLFSLTRNNPERNVGAAGTLQDLNVAISRSKEKLIILGNFEMMLNGWAGHASSANGRHHYKSPARKLARLVDSKYGRVVGAPTPLIA